MLVILFGGAGTSVGQWLARPALVATGLISYSLYLWHQPLLAFGRVAANGPLSLIERLALVGAAGPLAVMSWVWIERPFRNRRRIGNRAVWASAALFTAACALVGWVGFKSDGLDDLKLGLLSADVRPFVIDRPRELARREPGLGSQR